MWKKKIICCVMSAILAIGLLFSHEPGEVYAKSQNDVVSQLNSLINQYNGKTATGAQMYNGSQCKGFANWVFLQIFGVYIGAYPDSANYLITNPNAQTIGIIEPGNLNVNTAKELLKKGAPGDYIQVQRSTARNRGPHSMILTGVNDNGIEVFDCNSDGRNTIKTYPINWAEFDTANRAMSLYRANGYSPSDSAPENTPENTLKGYIDAVTGGAGSIYIRGWACDTSRLSDTVNVDVYVGGPAGSGAPCMSRFADKLRTDVNDITGFGNYHGFVETIETDLTGDQTIYIYIVNVNTGNYVLLGTQTVHISKKELAAPKIRAWISSDKMGEAAEMCRSGERYYLCYELLDPSTGMRYDSVTNCTYTVKETIYSPDGTVAGTYTYNNDNNWISYQTRNAGEHKGVIEVSGDISGTYEMCYTIPKVSNPQMKAWISKSKMGEKVEELKRGKTYYLCYEIIDKDTQKRWNELSYNNYQVKGTIYDQNGGMETSYTYSDSDNNWIEYKADVSGKHTYSVEISGDYEGNIKDEFEVEDIADKVLYYGDLDNNGEISISDLSTLNQAVNGSVTLSEDMQKRADLNGDGMLTEADVELLNQYILEIITEFPVERQLVEIKITKEPDKISYYVGDSLSMAGMRVTAVYGNGNEKEITNYQINGTTNNAGKQNVIVSYTEDGITKTAIQQIEVIKRHVHQYTEEITKAATCTEEGVKTYTCSCGDTYTERIEKLAHSWDSGVITKQPTATEPGIKTFTCTICNEKEIQVIPTVEEHIKKLKEIQITSAPDKVVYCVGDTLDMTGMGVIAIYEDGSQKEIYDYIVGGSTEYEGINDIVIAYMEDGIAAFARQEIEVIKEHVHEYSEYITKAATCESEGAKTYICSCGDSYIESIEKTHHTIVKDQAEAATCSKTGKTEGSHCGVCGIIIVDQKIIPKTEHLWDAGVVTRSATETQEGIRTFTCMVCKEQKTQTIPVTEIVSDDKEEIFVEKGDIVRDVNNEAEYEVVSVNGDEVCVEFVELLKKKNSVVKIGDAIETQEGLFCKVVSVSSDAFKNNKSINRIVIGDNVTIIGSKAFYGCRNLKSIELGSSVSVIESNAFAKCTKLTEIVLPANVTKIGSNAFFNCKKLQRLVIKSRKLALKKLGRKTFKGIPKKTSVQVPENKLRAYKKMFRQRGLHAKNPVFALKQ